MPDPSLRVPTPSKPPEPFFGKLARIGLIVVVGCAGLAWGGLNAKRGAASDVFRNIGSHLLKFETFSPATAAATLEGTAAQNLSGCDVHAQRALLLLEIPLAYAALQSGAVQEFDRRSRSLEARTRQALSCNPRDSFVWLVLFGLHTGRGQIDENAFDLLRMSYETSPYEVWIAARRLTVAVPVILSAPNRCESGFWRSFNIWSESVLSTCRYAPISARRRRCGPCCKPASINSAPRKRKPSPPR